MANVECPICLVKFSSLPNYADNALHPAVHDCPLSNYEWPVERWNMRPPKKEQPINTIHLEPGEVAWLRRLVEKLVLEDPSRNYETTTFYPDYCGGKSVNKAEGAGE